MRMSLLLHALCSSLVYTSLFFFHFSWQGNEHERDNLKCKEKDEKKDYSEDWVDDDDEDSQDREDEDIAGDEDWEEGYIE